MNKRLKQARSEAILSSNRETRQKDLYNKDKSYLQEFHDSDASPIISKSRL